MITRIISNKTSVLLGLIIDLLARVTQVFTTNYDVLFVSRFLLGSGISLFNVLAYSLITKYYESEEKNRLLGYQAALTALESTIFSLFAGWLLQSNCSSDYSFWIIFASDKQILDQSVVVKSNY